MRRPASDTPRRASTCSFRAIGDEGGLVVLPARAEVKVLNPVGSRVFALIDGHRSVDEIARVIADEFDVTAEQAISDVDVFLFELEEQGMVEPASSLSAEPTA